MVKIWTETDTWYYGGGEKKGEEIWVIVMPAEKVGGSV